MQAERPRKGRLPADLLAENARSEFTEQ